MTPHRNFSPWAADFPFLDAVRDDPARPVHDLDAAATTQILRPALEALVAFEGQGRANVHRGVHRKAELATEGYETARTQVADWLGVARDEIIFTSGTTAAINLLAVALGDRLGPGDEIVLSALDHHANLVPWHLLARRRGVVLRALPVTGDGRLQIERLADLVGPRTRLIALTHASNVTGAVIDPAPVVAAARTVGAMTLLDGAQMARHRVAPAALGVDFYVFSGHKTYGATGAGVVWGRGDRLADLGPAWGGGGMIRRVTATSSSYADVPRRFEAGTPPIGAVLALGAACAWLAGQDHAAIAAHEARLTRRLIEGLRHRLGVRMLGPDWDADRIGVVSFDLAGAHPHDVAQILDGFGVAIRAGHHCCQPLMEAAGLIACNRASLAAYNDDSDIDRLLEALSEAARRLT